MPLTIYPALDLRGGRVVRLRQGERAQETHYSDDPVAVARAWVAQGATWLHVVDLDGAFEEGEGLASPNRVALAAIVRAVGGVPVQTGGGLRRAEDVAAVLALGVARVVLGTVAVTMPEVVAACVVAHGAERVAVGIDARAGVVAIRGWQAATALSALELARRVRAQGVTRVIYTDIARDGMLGGVNVAATVALAQAAQVGVIASGGVQGVEDVRALAAAGPGVEGVIVGQALYTGRLTVADALAAAAG